MKKVMFLAITAALVFSSLAYAGKAPAEEPSGPGYSVSADDGSVSMGPADNSGDGVSDGSGMDPDDAPSSGPGSAPNSGDGIPDGSGFPKP